MERSRAVRRARAPQVHHQTHGYKQFHHLSPPPPLHLIPPLLLASLELGALDWNLRVTLRRAWFRFFLVLRGRTLRITSRLGDHDAISVTLSRNERCKATILVAATSAFDPVRELDRQLLCTIASRFLEERCEYEDNEHDGKHVQYHRCRSPGRQQSCFPLRMHPPSPS